MGYLTNAADRAVLTGGIDRVVDGVLRGIVRFVDGRPPAEGREQLVQPAPLDCRRFNETGQEVCGPFLRAWEARGGLVRFGLPITAEIEEGDPATGKERTVQYFERARFDHVPDRVGTLDEIRLGMVGSAAIANRADESPFAPIAAFADTDERRFFPETGHSLAGGFKRIGRPRAVWRCMACPSPRSSRSATHRTAGPTPCSISSAPASSTTRSTPARRTRSSSATSAGMSSNSRRAASSQGLAVWREAEYLSR